MELVQVNGRWRDRVNVEEAKTVADVVADFMRQHDELSYGVVTMNQPQRELIEAEIELRAANNGKIGAYRERWDDQLEPPFVKNLENVQGDERDVIFISLGWGRTPEGAMHQRFFPINRREDGHRRLNVLFTRAKRKVVLFSSLRPEDIVVDPERTARGVQVLRNYLLYARDGQLGGEVSGSAEAENPFELSVANALRAHGHRVVPQLGVAGYRIDIAVEHPGMPSRYVLGIECDGAQYNSAKSARDRDRLRQEALERLGWRVTRVWSTDLFHDQGGQTARLCLEIEDAIRSLNAAQEQQKRLVCLDAAIESVGTVIREEGYAYGQASSVGQPELPLDGEIFFALGRAVSEATTLGDFLRKFRLEVIMRDLPDSDPDRCILREEMINAILKSKLDDPDEFREKIPLFLR